MAPFATSIRWFRDIRLDDVAVVGGKNASLGELYSVLSEQGVRVPNGFALTADAYRNALTEAGAWDRSSATDKERQLRKRRLIKGPKELRDIRKQSREDR
jgi:phosphoenolpyruvate synthase/pyruvate phosphate dikinase